MKTQKKKKIHQLLQLHPHKHTGKLLHHKHTSYRSLFLLLAIVGAFMITMNHMAKAADYQVTAVIPAPLPNAPANITNPKDGDTVYGSTIHLIGTCPIVNPAIIVVAYDNGTTLLGSQTCSASGTFDITVSLGSVGMHNITTTIMNFTGQTGATSAPISIIYVFGTAPTIRRTITSEQVVTTTSQTTGPVAAEEWPKITANSPFVIYAPGKDIVWTGTFTRGKPPYTVSVDWGDASTQTGKNVVAGNQTFRHFYDTPGTYTVRITIKDTSHHETIYMFTAICPTAFRTQPATTNHTPTIIGTLYALYLIAVLVLVRVWWRQRLHKKLKPVYARIYTHRHKPQTKRKR